MYTVTHDRSQLIFSFGLMINDQCSLSHFVFPSLSLQSQSNLPSGASTNPYVAERTPRSTPNARVRTYVHERIDLHSYHPAFSRAFACAFCLEVLSIASCKGHARIANWLSNSLVFRLGSERSDQAQCTLIARHADRAHNGSSIGTKLFSLFLKSKNPVLLNVAP